MAAAVKPVIKLKQYRGSQENASPQADHKFFEVLASKFITLETCVLHFKLIQVLSRLFCPIGDPSAVSNTL